VPKLSFRFQALLGSHQQGAVPFPKRFRGGGGLYQVVFLWYKDEKKYRKIHPKKRCAV
jgi:hypothetical protein